MRHTISLLIMLVVGAIVIFGSIVYLVQNIPTNPLIKNTSEQTKEITVFSKLHGTRMVDTYGTVIDTERNQYRVYDNDLYSTLNEGRNYTVTFDEYNRITDVKW